MRILILGGTVFLGRALVEGALARGHTVTLFNRGRSSPDLFPDVEQLHGNRSADLEPLRGRRWDAVVDTSGYVPRVVSASARLLADAVARYAFVSTLSVYADVSRPGTDERAAVGTLADATVEEVTAETYGPLKSLCEQAVEEVLPGRVLVIRPGMLAVDVSKALAAGLTFRPLADTVRATLEWAATRPADHTWRAGIARAREAELLAAWQKL